MKFATVTNISILAVVSSGLFGCSVLNTAGESTFSCPGLPQGVTCKTPTAVYKSTNGQLPITESDLPLMGRGKESAASPKVDSQPALQSISLPASAYGQEASKIPLPVRSNATVMRIWIAPWIDKNDDLHLPSFLYTEVQGRKWNLGETEFSGNGVSIPHRVVELASGQTIAAPVKPNDGNNPHHAVPIAANASAATPQPQDDLNLGDN